MNLPTTPTTKPFPTPREWPPMEATLETIEPEVWDRIVRLVFISTACAVVVIVTALGVCTYVIAGHLSDLAQIQAVK